MTPGLRYPLMINGVAVAGGGELRLILAAEGPVARVLTLTGLDRFISSFGSLDRALAPVPAPPCGSASRLAEGR